jgi:hypothetical protein
MDCVTTAVDVMVSVKMTTETADEGTAVTWRVEVSVTVEVTAVTVGDAPATHEVVPLATSNENALAEAFC